jgi:MFS family permease
LIGSIYYWGVLTTLPFLPALADWYGRKRVVIGAFIFCIIAQLTMVFASDLFYLYASLYVQGMTLPGRFIVALVYINEFMPTDWRDSISITKLVS